MISLGLFGRYIFVVVLTNTQWPCLLNWFASQKAADVLPPPPTSARTSGVEVGKSNGEERNAW